jgi:hypothetical protein
MLRRLLALALLAGAAVAQQPPACSGLALRLRATKQATPGGSTTASFLVQNTGSAAVSNLVVGFTLPAEYQKPHHTSVRPNLKPRPTVAVSVPTTVWRSVSIPAGKTLRFAIKSKLGTCQPAATALNITAVAYTMDASNAIACLSSPTPATVRIKARKRTADPCPTPSPPEPVPIPIPGVTVTVVAENQAFAGADPVLTRRLVKARGLRGLEVTSLVTCIEACNSTLGMPSFAVYNEGSNACACCASLDTCGTLVPSPGTAVYEILPYTLCKKDKQCVNYEKGPVATPLACMNVSLGSTCAL